MHRSVAFKHSPHLHGSTESECGASPARNGWISINVSANDGSESLKKAYRAYHRLAAARPRNWGKRRNESGPRSAVSCLLAGVVHVKGSKAADRFDRKVVIIYILGGGWSRQRLTTTVTADVINASGASALSLPARRGLT